MTHPVTSALLLALTLSLAALTVDTIRREPRRLGNAALIGVTALAALVTGTSFGSSMPGQLFVIGVVLLPPAILVLVVFLVWNGVVMLRKERRAARGGRDRARCLAVAPGLVPGHHRPAARRPGVGGDALTCVPFTG